MRVVFFDGHCNLCNGFVDWLFRVDRAGRIQVASLQGETARRLLGEGVANSGSVIYFREGERLTESSAVLAILRDVGGWARLAVVFALVPRPLRDLTYRFVARNRYRFFGQRATCRLPTPEERARFLP